MFSIKQAYQKWKTKTDLRGVGTSSIHHIAVLAWFYTQDLEKSISRVFCFIDFRKARYFWRLTNLWTHIFLALLGPEIVFDTSSPWFFRSLVQQDEARHPPRHAHISLHIRFLAFSQDQKWKHRQVSNLLSKSTLTLIINSMLLTYCHRPGRDSCVIRMRVEVQLVV